MAKKIQLGGEIELEGDGAVVVGFARISKSADDAAGNMDDAAKKAKKASKAFLGLSATAKALKGSLKSVVGIGGKALKFATGLAAVGAGVGAVGIKAFGDFQLQMARIGTLLPEGVDAMDRFGQAVEDASVKYGQAVDASAEGFFQGISAGVSSDQIEEFSEVVGKAATGAFVDQAVAVDGLTNVMNTWGDAAGDAALISDKMFVANRLGKTTFGELASSMGVVSSQANAMGVQFDDVLGVVVSATKAGQSTSTAMAGLRQVMVGIQKPTQEALDLAEDLDINFSEAGLRAKGFAGFMEEIRQKTGGSSTALAQLFGSVEAIGLATRLTSKEGLSELKGSLEELGKAAGTTDRNFDRVASTTGFKLQQIQQGMNQWIRDIGRGLVEGLKLDTIEDIPGAVKRVSTEIRNFTRGFAEGFAEAFGGVEAFGTMDWAQSGKDMGEFAARIVTGIKDMATWVGNLAGEVGILSAAFEGLSDLAGAGGPVQRAAKAMGSVAIDVGKVRDEERAKLLQEQVEAAQSPEEAGGALTAAAGNALFSALNQFAAGDLGQAVGVNRVDPNLVDADVLAERVQNRLKEINDRAQLEKRLAADAAQNQKDLLNLQQVAEEEVKRLQGGVTKLSSTFSDFGDDLLKSLKITLNLDQTTVTNFDTKKRRPKRSSTSFERGQGDATIPTTFEQQFLILDGELLAVPDNLVLRPADEAA